MLLLDPAAIIVVEPCGAATTSVLEEGTDTPLVQVLTGRATDGSPVSPAKLPICVVGTGPLSDPVETPVGSPIGTPERLRAEEGPLPATTVVAEDKPPPIPLLSPTVPGA